MTDNFIWWKHGIVYQIYPRSFMDSNGDGVGDLQGVIDRMDYLQDLGIDAIWFSPIFPSPMADFGYDVSDYCDIHPLFGDLATFDKVVAAAHARGIKVVIDYVPNHTSDQHPWFIESRSSRENPKRNWFIWRDAKPDGSPPNNWISFFGGSAWEWDEHTQQYYLHMFLKEQPDVDWRNPEVEKALLDVLHFWGKRGVDGFRMDVIFVTLKHPDLPDQPSAAYAGSGKDMGDFSRIQHIYDYDWGEERQKRVSSIRALLDTYNAVGIGETYFLDPAQIMPYYGENMDGLHLPFNFTLMHLPWQASAFRQTIGAYYNALPAHAQPNFVIGSHDENRFATRYGAANARAAGMLLMTLWGTPTWYYGDELGMVNVPIPREKMQDPWGINNPQLAVSRDPARTPMQWDTSPNAGFAPAGVETWLPLAEDFTVRNVAVEQSDPNSDLNYYKTLFKLRRETPALHGGTFAWVEDTPEGVLAYQREAAGQKLLVLINFTDQPQTIVGARHVSPLLSTLGEAQSDGTNIHLRPHEGLIVRL